MRWFRSLLILLIPLLAVGCTRAGQPGPGATAFAGDGRLKVAASIYPVYEFARAVGGDRIDLVLLVPPGTEPHDWEPSVGDVRTLNAADIFLYSGAGFEHWVDQALASLDNRDLVAVETSGGFDLLAGSSEAEDHEGHDHGDLDPHLWLDPAGAAHMVERIAEALSAADPADADAYRTNAAAYRAELAALDQEFSAGLAQCRRRVFFTTHAAFGYLAHRYGLEQRAIMGLSPDAEPTPRALKAVVEEARENDVRHIFFESLVSDRVARVVADEIGASTLVLNPFEGLTPEQVAAGESYLSVMRQNLANLRVALECE
ncbi:zinc transport system substrate-binding protein [Symbiobacterium terraclitae]|uniref:Zinc transport system substrate-binding protein n=1 Tax=Symbiobacterium terraclitae TaxID=557451 RepID=A0ABS4JM95_9FIRM|nr:zinc transport system substrate-binding protein [Symbiobacterium terraclitae]